MTQQLQFENAGTSPSHRMTEREAALVEWAVEWAIKQVSTREQWPQSWDAGFPSYKASALLQKPDATVTLERIQAETITERDFRWLKALCVDGDCSVLTVGGNIEQAVSHVVERIRREARLSVTAEWRGLLPVHEQDWSAVSTSAAIPSGFQAPCLTGCLRCKSERRIAELEK